MKLKAIIGKVNGRINDNDKYEVEGMFQAHSVGWTVTSSVHQTNSGNVLAPIQDKTGKNLYIESMEFRRGARFCDPQGFFRKLAEHDYSVIDSKIEVEGRR